MVTLKRNKITQYIHMWSKLPVSTALKNVRRLLLTSTRLYKSIKNGWQYCRRPLMHRFWHITLVPWKTDLRITETDAPLQKNHRWQLPQASLCFLRRLPQVKWRTHWQHFGYFTVFFTIFWCCLSTNSIFTQSTFPAVLIFLHHVNWDTVWRQSLNQVTSFLPTLEDLDNFTPSSNSLQFSERLSC